MSRVTLHNGRITLINGNCLEVMQKIKPACIDFVFADLPYGTTACKWDSVIDPKVFWQVINNISKINASIHLMTGDWPFMKLENISNYRYSNYWDKRFGANFTQAKRQPMYCIETIECYYRSLPMYNPQMIQRDKPIKSGKRAYARAHTGTSDVQVYDAEQKVYTEKYPTNLISIDRSLGALKLHPTEKPVELLEYLIKTYSNENDVILDPTMGSGTTAVACINTNRRCIGIELDTTEGYFQTAITRCEQAIKDLTNVTQ